MKFTWSSFKKTESPKIVGRLLEVSLPLFGIEGVVAKVDTGAHSGALHATRIREIKDENGVKRLRFSPLGSAKHTLEVNSFHKRRVKSSNGLIERRYAIDTQIEIFGQTHPITITLTNRGSMKYQMLIGSMFLKTHGFLIDVSHDNK